MKSAIQSFLDELTSPGLVLNKANSELLCNMAFRDLILCDEPEGGRPPLEGELIEQLIEGSTVSLLSLRPVEFSKAHYRALSERIVEAQEGERSRLSREVHDGILQCIVGSRMLLARALVGLPRSSHVFEELIGVEESLCQANLEGRKLLRELRPALLEKLNLSEAVHHFLEQVKHERNLRAQFDFKDFRTVKFSPIVRGNLFRIIQECVRNAVQHSSAERVTISIGNSKDTGWVKVEDWGTGFLIQDVNPSASHIGLTSLHERAQSLGGRCLVSSEPGEGTTIEVRVPLNAPPTSGFTRLRSRAQAALYKRPAVLEEESLVSELSIREAAALFHEFEVHRMELEIQNSELRQAKSQLETSRRGYRGLYEYATVGYFEIDAEDRIASANLTLSSMLGCPREELIGRPVNSILGPSFRADTIATGGCEVKIQSRNPPGWCWAKIENSFTNDGLRQLTVTDISSVRQSEEELSKLSTQLKLSRKRESLALRQEDSLLEISVLLQDLQEQVLSLTDALSPKSVEWERVKGLESMCGKAISRLEKGSGPSTSSREERTHLDVFLRTILSALYPSSTVARADFFPEAEGANFEGDSGLLGILLEDLLRVVECSLADTPGRLTVRSGFVDLPDRRLCFVDVADAGVGKVEQADPSSRATRSLSEARTIAQTLGGQISLLDEIGRGMTVRVHLPITEPLPRKQD